MSADIDRYCAQAIRFRVADGRGRSMRVARTLLTCRVAAAALNGLQVPPEAGSSYRFVNIYNPTCPLFFDTASAQWRCEPALEQHPAWCINWAGANLICGHLGARLPDEHEWEALASNNDPGRIFPWGNAPPTKDLANFAEHFGGPTEVHRFAPSDLGLHDLAGNLAEWCADSDDTTGNGLGIDRVVKGGAWSKDASQLEISSRRSKWARLGTTTIGLRPVWDD